MNDKDLISRVEAMRFAQRRYFATRSQHALMESKDLEREVDRELQRRNDTQRTLFEGQQQ